MRILLFTISFFCLCTLDGFSQKEKEAEIKKDTIIYKTGYGLRVGIDISKPIKAQLDGSYNGLELVADYRVSKNWYVAVEFGNEEETSLEPFTTSFAEGNYVRIGANYNTYKNWLDMNNEIFVGGRIGYASFNQTLTSVTPNTGSNYFPSETIVTNKIANDLSASWFEFQIGIKTETIPNLFLSVGFAYKILLSVEEPNNFKTLFAPGFNRIFASNTGFGFNYTISYLIPFTKK